MRSTYLLTLLLICVACSIHAQERPVVKLWPATPPGDANLQLPEERDLTKDTDGAPAGRRVMRIGNVSTPTLTVYAAPAEKANGTAVIICPGGGHSILAWDLEGTEVAEWLNDVGVTAFVLKYRVPARKDRPRHLAAVQDAQRAVSLVRSRASEWKLDAKKIGILGFSAGGQTAALACTFGGDEERLYDAVDPVDQTPSRPDFGVLVYPAYLANQTNTGLADNVKITEKTPPMFFAHAHDDRIHPANSVLTYLALKENKVPAELHVYATGGHGFGLRKTDHPSTTWPARCAEWMTRMGWMK